MKNKTIVITGKSSSGKDSLQNHLVSNYDFINLVSHTTRPPRPNESNGYDYYFEYIDNGKQWQAAKDNNQRIISAVKSFNIPKEQLFSIIDKVFSEKEANDMKKIFS